MSERNGKLQGCDRCGATCFRECIGEGETDGGFTRWNKFEPAPDGWGWHSETGMLCPICNSEYNDLIAKFMGRTKPDGA